MCLWHGRKRACEWEYAADASCGGGGHPPDDQESMCEGLECKDRRSDLQYDPGEPEDITRSLMKLSELSLHDFLADEPDVYTVDDLKVRYR